MLVKLAISSKFLVITARGFLSSPKYFRAPHGQTETDHIIDSVSQCVQVTRASKKVGLQVSKLLCDSIGTKRCLCGARLDKHAKAANAERPAIADDLYPTSVGSTPHSQGCGKRQMRGKRLGLSSQLSKTVLFPAV